MPGTIHVAYCFDDNMALPGAVTILSLIRANPQEVCIHVFTDPEPKCAPLLRAIAQAEGAEIRIIDEAPEKQADLDTRSDYGIATSATYRRIFLPDLLPDLDRVIYIDADTVVPGSLRELWELDLAGNALGAVRDPWMITSETMRARLPEGYFNAGVLLADLASWRARGISESALGQIAILKERAEEYGGSALDYRFEQTPLNFACVGQWLELSPRWNCTTMLTPGIGKELGYADGLIDEVLDDPGIVHLLAGHKPWLPGFETTSRWHKLFDRFRRELEANFDTSGLSWPGAFTNGRQAELDRRIMAMRLVKAARDRGMERPAVVLTGLLGPEVVKVAGEQGFEIDCFITEYPALVGHHAHGLEILSLAEAFASGRQQVVLADYRRLERTRGIVLEAATAQNAQVELLAITDC